MIHIMLPMQYSSRPGGAAAMLAASCRRVELARTLSENGAGL